MADTLKERLQKAVTAPHPPSAPFVSASQIESNRILSPPVNSIYGGITEAPVIPRLKNEDKSMSKFALAVVVMAVVTCIAVLLTRQYYEMKTSEVWKKKMEYDEAEEEDNIIATDPFFQSF